MVQCLNLLNAFMLLQQHITFTADDGQFGQTMQCDLE
jgi:hypothetical protein